MISIILIVKNDRRIEKLLDSLKNIKKPEKTEILVVDASEGALDDIKIKFTKVKWYSFRSPFKNKRTYSEQRNYGLSKAKGDLLVFVDSDCVVKDNWLVELYTSLRNGEDVVSGKVESINTNKLHDSQWNNRKSEYVNECCTMNLAFTRKVFKKVGLFDINLEEGEDLDYSWRIVENGFRILNSQKSVIYHDWGSFRSDINRSFRYGKAKTKIYRKHFRQRWSHLLKKDFYLLVYPAYILAFPLTYFIPWFPLLLIIPIMKNINNFPFKNTVLAFSKAVGILVELILPSRINEIPK